MGSPAKTVKKLIPKEIKPALPYIAAYFGGPMLASQFSMNPVFAKALSASLASKIQGDDTKTALRSGIFAAAPDVISGGLQKAGATLAPQTTEALKKTLTMSNVGSNAVPVSQQIGSILSSAGKSLSSTGYTPGNAISFKDAAKVIGGQTAVEAGTRLAELNEKALRDYEEQLRSQGITDSAERRNQIFGYFSRAGYGDTEINSMLDKYGYAYGGRVGYEGGGLADLLEYLKKKEDEDEFRISDLTSAVSGFETAFGKPMMERPQPMGINPGFGNMPRMKFAEGGVSMTDEGRSGVIYRDEQGNPISKEEFLKRTYEEEFRDTKTEGGIPMTQNARKTIKELIEAGVLEDEGEGILDLIRKNPKMIGGPIMPIQQHMEKLRNLKEIFSMENIQNFIEDFKQKNGRNPTNEEIGMGISEYTPGFADGGMLNFGGREMDMRGGGFIPIGAKERADDVPARLSKNEFVMTANAVRSAGNGNINKGAKRMYDLMNKLEAKA